MVFLTESPEPSLLQRWKARQSYFCVRYMPKRGRVLAADVPKSFTFFFS